MSTIFNSLPTLTTKREKIKHLSFDYCQISFENICERKKLVKQQNNEKKFY